MASGLSTGQDTALMTHQLGTTSYALPTTIAIALSTNSGGLGNAKAFASEFTTVNSNYARIYAGTSANGVGSSNWTIGAFIASTGVIASNLTQVSFLAASGSAGTQTLTSVCFMSSLTYASGNLLFFADLGTSQAIAVTIIVAFFVGDISFTLN
jgi:hypothetical protein